LLAEAQSWKLRSACEHCFFYVARERRCGHEWPNGEQRRWPLDKPNDRGERPETAEFCKEFELA
jgi:hypothetical protein